MEEYKPNSHLSKRDQPIEGEVVDRKKVEKIVSGSVKTKKKSGLRKFADIFINDDAQNVKSYIFLDVLIPSMKKAISDVVTNGIDMILYGETKHSKKNSPASKVSYRSYYDDKKEDQRSRYSRSRTSSYDYDDIIIANRGEAEEVLIQMDAMLEKYGVCSIADYYDLVGVTGVHTDNKYGWMDLRNASVVRVRDGYIIKLPRAVPLD